jgi:hypothetical protein
LKIDTDAFKIEPWIFKSKSNQIQNKILDSLIFQKGLLFYLFQNQFPKVFRAKLIFFAFSKFNFMGIIKLFMFPYSLNLKFLSESNSLQKIFFPNISLIFFKLLYLIRQTVSYFFLFYVFVYLPNVFSDWKSFYLLLKNIPLRFERFSIDERWMMRAF